jgi:Endosomal/lysosomal potassium channel TMEM175
LQQIGPFEMRRLEALSNTIFGVAMTLLAYDLPKASVFKNAPTWIDLVRAYAQPLIALMISFIVAGLFWFSHHRRLAVAPEGSRGEVFLNLIFLVSIIILPVTNGLYGAYRLDGVVAVIYGAHLTVIATLNALLWLLALRGRGKSRVAGNGDLSRPRFHAGYGCRDHRPDHCSIHMVFGIWRACGGLAGGAALTGRKRFQARPACVRFALQPIRASHFRECS